MNINDFASNSPTFVLEDFFHGQLRGWGLTMGRLGGLQNRFSIDAEGNWDKSANTLSLSEVYAFDDGHVDTLSWTIIKRSASVYEGRETHVDGVAKGEQKGNAFHWTYTREVPAKDGSTSDFGFDDWFWLHDPARMAAHASLTKLAVEVSTLNVFYQKL